MPETHKTLKCWSCNEVTQFKRLTEWSISTFPKERKFHPGLDHILHQCTGCGDAFDEFVRCAKCNGTRRAVHANGDTLPCDECGGRLNGRSG